MSKPKKGRVGAKVPPGDSITDVQPTVPCGPPGHPLSLDLAGAEQIRALVQSCPQRKRMRATAVAVFATGGAARVSWGPSPSAQQGAGSITVGDGQHIIIHKQRDDAVAVCAARGATNVVVDIVPVNI
jgi:hypothetical protein